MKYKLLTIPSNHGRNNIGDYVQALAASQFYPSIDGFVNREALSDYCGEYCKVIMNGWYMHHPEKWPPSEYIIPLFVAFHLNDSAKERMLSKEGIAYLKKYEPIGCRDLYTVSLLKNNGIDAYFSGCLTLTLGERFKSDVNNGDICIVDPYIPNSKSIIQIIKDFFVLMTHLKSVRIINKKLKPCKNKIKSFIISSRFFRTYSMWFEKEELCKAKYIIQESEEYSNINSDMERLEVARKLVVLYSQAQYVITSRIHCGLPCIGLETPVYFVRNKKADFISTCRYNGLIELFNVFYCDSKGLSPDFTITGKISSHNIIKNKLFPKDLVESLKMSCKKFVSN